MQIDDTLGLWNQRRRRDVVSCTESCGFSELRREEHATKSRGAIGEKLAPRIEFDLSSGMLVEKCFEVHSKLFIKTFVEIQKHRGDIWP